MSISLMIVDDSLQFRDGLRHLVGQHPVLEWVGEAENGEEAVRLADELNPDLIIMDVVMPVLNGMEATRRILAGHPDTRVIALSMYSDPLFVNEMFKAGARGFLIKECAFEELERAVIAVLNGDRYLSDRLDKSDSALEKS